MTDGQQAICDFLNKESEAQWQKKLEWAYKVGKTVVERQWKAVVNLSLVTGQQKKQSRVDWQRTLSISHSTWIFEKIGSKITFTISCFVKKKKKSSVFSN